MPTTSFPEYARQIQAVIDEVIRTGEAHLLNLHRPTLSQLEHKHTPTGIELSTAPTLSQVLDEIL